jgi:DNA-binding Lrp family transcriptional regulator
MPETVQSWRYTAAMITAIVLINTAQGRASDLAQALIELPGIAEAWSVAGSYDLVALVRVSDHEKLADVVAGQVQNVPGITATNTLIAFRAYSRRDLESMWDIGNEEVAG